MGDTQKERKSRRRKELPEGIGIQSKKGGFGIKVVALDK